MRTIFKVFIEFITLLLFVLVFCTIEPLGIIAPNPGTEQAPPDWKVSLNLWTTRGSRIAFILMQHLNT